MKRYLVLLLVVGVAQAQELLPAGAYKHNQTVALPTGTMVMDDVYCPMFALQYAMEGMPTCYVAENVEPLSFEAEFISSFENAGYVTERVARVAEHVMAHVLVHPDWSHELTVFVAQFPEQPGVTVVVILRPVL